MSGRNKIHLGFAYLTIGLTLLPGCHFKQSSGPVAQEIQRRGYHSTEDRVITPSRWEVATFRMRSKRGSSFRADKPLPNTSDYFCRFSFFEESYDSAEDARQRLANIHVPAPDGPAEERDYLSTMRGGFRVGNVAYILQTDAAVFWDEVQRLTNELARATPGAEQSAASR
jgi:hypothetical protein